MSQNPIVALTLILSLGIAAQWLASFTGIPSILLLLGLGFTMGPFLGWINPDMMFGDLLLPIVSLSVAIILFEGGLSLQIRRLRNVGNVILRIVLICSFITFVLVTLFVYYVLGYSLAFSLLLGAILIITGPTVIIPILSNLNVKEPIRSILRWDGIISDPLGALVAICVLEAVLAHTTAEVFFVVGSAVFKTLFVGVVIGSVASYIILLGIRYYWLEEAHHNPVVFAMVLACYVFSNHIQVDAGLIAVTIMGLVIANQKATPVIHITDFKENIRVILNAFLFITLAGSIEVSELQAVFLPAMALVVFLVLIVRPLGVYCATSGTTLSKEEKLFACFLAPRGIVSAALASLFGLELEKLGFAGGEFLSPMTFVVIAATVIIYSVLAPLLVSYLQISSHKEEGILIIGANQFSRAIAKMLKKAGYKVQLVDSNKDKVAQARNARLKVFNGNFLAYEAKHSDSLEDTGMVLAMTENDEVNSIAVLHFQRHFDQAEVYQLAPSTSKLPETLLGRMLFDDKMTPAKIQQRLDRGETVQMQTFSENETYDNWKKEKGKETSLLFKLYPDGQVEPETPQSLLSLLGKGTSIIYLGPQS